MSKPKKKPEELTDQELNSMMNDTQAAINGLKSINTKTLTQEQAQECRETLQRAYGLGEVLALEQLRRLMVQLKGKVSKLKERATQAKGGAGNE